MIMIGMSRRQVQDAILVEITKSVPFTMMYVVSGWASADDESDAAVVIR